MIIYIHGFGGSGNGLKASLFKSLTCNEPILAPTLSYIPEMSIMTLCELIEMLHASSDEKLRRVKLIGSSLGGFYAHYLSYKYDLKAVLLNPALFPFAGLKKYQGEALNYADVSHFEWNETHLKMLEKYDVPDTKKNHNILLLSQKGDEILDYREAVEKLQGASQVIDEGGNHGFENLERHLETIATHLHIRFEYENI
jgi:uncharacterized protein